MPAQYPQKQLCLYGGESGGTLRTPGVACIVQCDVDTALRVFTCRAKDSLDILRRTCEEGGLCGAQNEHRCLGGD